MSYGDKVRNARDAYADKYYGESAIRAKYEALINAESDPEKKRQLDIECDAAVSAFQRSPAQKAEAKAKANREIDKALSEMEARVTPVIFTAEQMTKRIQEVDPFYHFDCSPENLARQKALHEKALKALHDREIHHHQDPYAEMGRSVWSEDRSEDDYGDYIGMFMGEEDKAELSALAELAKAGKKQDPEFLRRRRDLHRRINVHATALADEKRREFENMTTEQMIEHYNEIVTFCRLGDTTNSMAPNLTPDECAAYHKKMNFFLNTLGIAMNKVSALGGPGGDRIDVEQLSALSKDQFTKIRGQNVESPDYLADDGGIDMDPMSDMEFVENSVDMMLKDQLADTYPQFAVEYSRDPSSASLYNGNFDRKLLYQSADGRELNEYDAMEEMRRWHRPVFISTANHPEAAPVMAFIDKGAPYIGAAAAEAFKNADLHREEQAPRFEPQTHLSGWQKFKMGFANFLESIPLLDINGDIFRDDDIIAYEEAQDAFDLATRRYEERQKSRELQDRADALTAPGYREMIQRKLLAEKPELAEKAAANRAAQAEAKRQEQLKKAQDDEKALNDWAKEKSLSDDEVDRNFREKLSKTGLPLEEQKKLLALHHILRDERHAQRDEFREKMDNHVEMSDYQLHNAAADAITGYLAESLLSSEVRRLVELATKDPDAKPKLSKELSELACVGAEGNAEAAIKDKLADKTAELRDSDAMQATRVDVREVRAMLFGQDKLSAAKHMIARVNNNAPQQPAGGDPAPQQAQKQAQQKQQPPMGLNG